MKVRDSGMPDAPYWESLFDVPLILDRMFGTADVDDVLEVGCGYGTFTIPLAQRIRGTLTALDVDPAMTACVQRRSSDATISNLKIVTCDADDTHAVEPGTQDAVLLFNILHGETPVSLLSFAAQCLRPGGRVYAIHWLNDSATPRGPALSIRPKPEQICARARATRILRPEGEVIELPPWHYGLILQRYNS